MKTAITELLSIEFPLIAFSHCRDVVAEVSKAGGLGVLGAIAFTPEELEIELNWIASQVDGKPYGVDLLLPVSEGVPVTGDVSSTADVFPQSHIDFVLRLMKQHGIDTTAEELWGDIGLALKGNQLWTARSDALLDVVFRHPIALIASALGTPTPKMIEGARARGIKTAALAGKAEHARRSVAIGADLIVAQGTEAGGHTGDISTMVLVPEIVDAVAPVPVLAAGGIGRGRQVTAALALGAEGVWCGSVWLTTSEAETEPAVKEKFLAASSSDTVRSRYRTGKPARQLKSAWTESWEKESGLSPLKTPFQSMLADPPLHRAAKDALKKDSGAAPLVTYFVGQIVGAMNEVSSTRQVVFDMMREYLETVERINRMTDDA